MGEAVSLGISFGGATALATLTNAAMQTKRIVECLKTTDFFADLGEIQLSMMAGALPPFPEWCLHRVSPSVAAVAARSSALPFSALYSLPPTSVPLRSPPP